MALAQAAWGSIATIAPQLVSSDSMCGFALFDALRLYVCYCDCLVIFEVMFAIITY